MQTVQYVVSFGVPLDHDQRLALALDSLEGLSVGDAIGEALSYRCDEARDRANFSPFSPGSVRYTDDTEMALAVVAQLRIWNGEINPDALAADFASRYQHDPDRGYGRMARRVLARIGQGEDWRTVSSEVFGGGSFGNGAAMRVAPLGAYHAGDPSRAAEQAAASARITHAHPEGIAGAVAVAVAASVAADERDSTPDTTRAAIWRHVIEHTPPGEVSNRLTHAHALESSPPADVARAVGCGFDISAQDTVPFCIWNACRCLGDYREAVLSAVEVDGDCDTNAAIIGGITAAYSGHSEIPADWLAARERLPT